MQTEQHYRNLYDTAPSAYIIVDEKGFISHCNQKACDLLEYTSENCLVGRKFLEICADTEQGVSQAKVILDEAVSGESIEGRELQVRKADGAPLWVSLSMNTIRADVGTSRQTRAIIENINDRKRMQSALHESEQRYRTLFNQLPQAVIVYDTETTLPIEFNDAAPDLLGYTSEEFSRLGITDYEAAETAEETAAHIARIIDGGSEIFESRMRKKDGQIIDVLVNVSTIEISCRKVLHSIITDVTHLKTDEKLLAEKNAILEGINHIFHTSLTCETSEELGHMCLAVTERIAGSKFGFIGEVNENGRFDTLSLSDPGWAECQIEKTHATRMLLDIEMRGFLFEAVASGKTVIVNDPDHHPLRLGSPDGHIPITSFMGVPLRSDGKIIGMIGLANRDGGFSSANRDAVEGVAVAIVEAIFRKRTEEKIRHAEQQWRRTFDAISDLVSVHAADFTLLQVNSAFAEFFNSTPEQLMGRHCYEVVHKISQPWPECPHLATLESGKNFSREVFDPAIGIPMLVSTSPIRDSRGEVLATVHICKDISGIKHTEAELKKQRDELSRRSDDLSTLYTVSRAVSGSIDIRQMSSEALNAILGLELFENLHKGGVLLIEDGRMNLIFDSSNDDSFRKMHEDMTVDDCLCGLTARTGKIVISKNSDSDPRHSITYDGMKPHGHVIVPLITRNKTIGVLYLYTPADVEISNDSLNLLNLIGEQLAVSLENSLLYEQTRSLSLHDSLTGLANRNLMQNELKKCNARASRYQKQFSVIMLDLDHFKKYNDTYGHTSGDRLLVDLARLVEHEIREVDTIARFGGEEFLIILPDTDNHYAAEVAERIRRRVEKAEFYYSKSQPPVRITISLGFASWNSGVANVDALLTLADNALYLAKSRGRNQVCSSPQD